MTYGVEHEAVGDVLHELPGDLLDVGMLLLSQHRIGLRQKVEQRKLGPTARS
jgi:hypothetical protein